MELNYIKKLRVNLGMTQREFGDLLGKKVNTISRWEKGESEPRIREIMNICTTFKVWYSINSEGQIAFIDKNQ